MYGGITLTSGKTHPVWVAPFPVQRIPDCVIVEAAVWAACMPLVHSSLLLMMDLIRQVLSRFHHYDLPAMMDCNPKL